MLLKKYFWIIHLILVTILVWAVVELTMTLVSSRLEIQTGGRSGVLASSRQESISVPPISVYDSIIQDNIFNPGVRIARRSAASETKKAASGGEPGKTSADQKETPPPTTLNVILKGTAVLDPERDSLAVIYDRGTQKEQLYHVGDSLYDASVETISTDRIILKRNGAFEMLSIIREEQKESSGKPAPKSLKPGRSSMVERKDAQNYVLDREQVGEMITNINQFMTQLRVRPHFSDGKPVGYLVTDIKPGSLIEQIGLHNGDIIKSVNGMPITKPDQAFAAYQQLMDESQVTLELQRGRGNQVITYELK